MSEVDQLIHQCATSALSARTDDLPALAQLHTNVRAVREAFDRFGTGGPIPDHSMRVEALIEQLVLREAEDADATLAEICRLIELIQAQSGASASAAIPATPSPVAPARPRVPAPAAAAAPEPDADLEEVSIGEEEAGMAMEFVGEATAHLEGAEGALLKLEEDPDATDILDSVFRGFHSIKGVAGFLNLRQVGGLAHAAETLLDLSRKGKLKLCGSRFDRVLDALDMMKRLVADVGTAAAARSAPPRQPGLKDLVRRLEMEAAGKSTAAEVPAVAADTGEEAPTGLALGLSHQLRESGDPTVKVATARLDALIDAVGELVIAQSMVAQGMAGERLAANPKLARNLSQLTKITRGLQDLSMSMRMVPVHGLFQKMARLARDTARKSAKEVEFSHSGDDTELDRNVVEAVGDPLVHMIRNAIDHGIEFADDRVRAGKPRAGRVALEAYHQGGCVVLEIRDDGKGLNAKRILEKAMAAGIVQEGHGLSEQEVFQFIFHPGLSTADRITDISGRGVGMDVVKRNVEALRGRIEIRSTPGQGSVFTIRLPLTLAVIDGLVVKVGPERYVLPIASVEQSIRPGADQISTIQSRGEICMVRGALLPLVRLHRLFDVCPASADPSSSIVVIAQDGDERCCLLVDELLGQQQVVIKSLAEGVGEVPGVSGCAILGDGNVSLILDVGGLIRSSRA